MGGFRSNGLNGTSNNGGGYNKDGTSSLLLDPATQQTYSDAPFSGLWRPESPRSRSDEEQSSSAPLRFRRLPRHWRVLVAAAVAIVCLLLLWFFLISPALFRKKIPEKTTSPIKESPISSKVDPVAAVVPASKTPKNQSTSLPAAETPQKKPKDDVYVSEIHNLPTERPSSTKIIDTAEQITTDSADFDEDDMLVLDRIELPTNGSQSSSTIVFSRIPAVEKGFQPKPVTMKPSPVVPTKTTPAPTTTTTPRPTTTTTPKTTPTTTTPRPTTTTTTTTTSAPQEFSSSSSAKEEDDDDEDLFWMRRRPVLSADKYRTQVEKPNPDPSRPTIKYDPVNAIHSVHKEDHHQQKNGGVKDNNHGDDNKDFPFATRQQQKITHSEPKKPSVSDYNNHPKSPISEEEEDKGAENGEEEEVENEELSDIIESIDEKSSGGDDDRGKVDASVVDGGEGFHHQRKDDDDIQPVVIPFDFDLKTVTMKEEKGGGKGSDFEPVWRRKPPEKTTTATETTEKNVEATKKIEAASTTPKNQLKNVQLLPDNPVLRKKRQQAPILVTALLDIGRGKWERFTRHFDQYLDYLKNMLLTMDNNIIVYCEPTVFEFLARVGPIIDWRRIQIVEISLMDLPFFRWRDEIEQIIQREQANWPAQWDKRMQTHPEALSPDYDIVVNSKSYFLYNATQISAFGNGTPESPQFFAWIDAGFGHGSKTVFPRGVWTPNLMAGKITVVQLNPNERVEKYTIDMVYRKQKTVVSGGFLAGDIVTIKRFHVFLIKIFMDLLDEGRVDDDQTTLLMTIREYRSTFNLIQGGWFDAFKLLPSQQQNTRR